MQHLSRKVRILVTHQLQYLKHADIIVVMKDVCGLYIFFVVFRLIVYY